MMRTKHVLIASVFILAACAAPRQATDSPEAPTQTPGTVADGSGGEVIPDESGPALSDAEAAEWQLLATFHWVDAGTNTSITYFYEAAFNVDPDGTVATVGIPLGRASGDAGINVNGECLETQPVIMEFAYALSGTTVEVPRDEVIGNYELSVDSVSVGFVQMFEVSLQDASVALIDVPPFARCAPDIDPEFVDSLISFWLVVIPDLPQEYRRFPAVASALPYCPGALSYEGEGLGTLEVCYTLHRP